ncbi:MAG: hypothetical protein WA865_03505 [Spirulinaceae cyanobacterium]
MTEDDPPKKVLYRHSVTEPHLCHQMAKKYGKDLISIEKSKDSQLPYNCVFQDEKPLNFQELWYDYQD